MVNERSGITIKVKERMKLLWIKLPNKHIQSIGKEFIYDIEDCVPSAMLTIKDFNRNIVIEHCFKKMVSAQTVSELIENG